MKIAIAYPPLTHKRSIPLLSQNRQFQWLPSNNITSYFIYPVVPASAATLLASKGYMVFWLDGLANKQSYNEWLNTLKDNNPDLIAIETKTPVVKSHWRIIRSLKKELPQIKIVLMGDHVTAFPEESLNNSPVDFVITGGDYDFLLLNLANHLSKKEKLEPGIYWRNSKNNKKLESSGKFRLNHDLDNLPMIDRDLTNWHLYSFHNSNFYRAPGAYTMFGRDCWWGKCTFCSWTTLFPGRDYRAVSVKKALDEVGSLIERYQVKEIMDDSGAFPNGDWLRNFCRGMIKRGYQKKVRFNCNMRFNSGLTRDDYLVMGKAGFRFILYGLESASQETLDRINKNLQIKEIEQTLRWAKEAGLMPHLTIMVGYPWENRANINSTISLAEKYFRDGLANSLQATIVIPYPGTPLYQYCLKNKLLRTTDWNRYDMSEPIMKSGISESELSTAVRSIYSRSIWTPRFVFNIFRQLNSVDGVKYVSFQGLKYFIKLLEFR